MAMWVIAVVGVEGARPHEIAAIAAPTLCIAADEDPSTPPDQLELIAERAAQVKLVELGMGGDLVERQRLGEAVVQELKCTAYAARASCHVVAATEIAFASHAGHPTFFEPELPAAAITSTPLLVA